MPKLTKIPEIYDAHNESGDVAKPVATLLLLTKLSSNDAYYSTSYAHVFIRRTIVVFGTLVPWSHCKYCNAIGFCFCGAATRKLAAHLTGPQEGTSAFRGEGSIDSDKRERSFERFKNLADVI